MIIKYWADNAFSSWSFLQCADLYSGKTTVAGLRYKQWEEELPNDILYGEEALQLSP